MRHCARHFEDLALLAGGDLPDGRETALQAHLAECAGCRELLEGLSDDHLALARLDATSADAEAAHEGQDEAFAREVLVALAGEAKSTRVEREVTPRRVSGPWLQAAAAIGITAVLAGWLTWSDGALPGFELQTFPLEGWSSEADRVQGVSLSLEGSPAAADPTLEPDATSLPIHVRRAGDGLELWWPGDGRELGGPARTYRVIASASPRNFDGAQSLEVAGNRFLATMAFPTRSLGDRDLTFFRVE